MKKLYPFFLLLVIPLLFFECSSGKKAFERGDYYDAVLKAVNRLRQKPDHKKSRETLRTGYPLALQTIEQDAKNSLASNAQFKYRDALRSYEKVNVMYEEIRRSPGALKVVPNPKNYYDKIADMKQRAAKESYDAGIVALNRDTREDAKNAYFYFQDVNTFVPGYKDVRNKLEEALYKATLKVVVEQIPVPTRYNLSARFFQDKIEEYLHSQFRSNQFVRFYTPREAKRENLPYVDQYLRLQFDDFVVGETHILKDTETITRDSVKVGKVTLEDGTTADAYGTVKAKLTVWKKEVVSKGLFSMQVFDANSNAVLTHRKFNGEFVWFSQWGSFNGDERALSDEQLAICKSSEVPPPPPQDLFIEFTRPIYDQLLPAVDSFYKRY
ncbi:hypothetical protein C900_04349 [Fulvivirga imtechensis AK7]|uniref:Uncharacterized protein n=1 Tax=Fulvivirga imtechensis AK7 TaxID=1237149 RepID=L8K212_9BACT|nr:hypothetical protein [Fulvivirga imtechensis]ELR73497.1 hypothetical protein C900_04349 [Fulvivirga imtechensis AK7]